MRVLRWILLTLYLLLIAGFVVFGIVEDGDWIWAIIAAVTVASIVVFLMGFGIKDLCLPLRPPRVILPLVIATSMMTLLVGGLTLALIELIFNDDLPGGIIAWYVLLILSWIFWAVLLYWYTRPVDRFRAVRRLAVIIFAGSLAELLATIPSHIVVSRRPGCLVGLGTMLGITAGVSVMIWSFGPGIFLLFVHGRYREELKHPRCFDCGYDLRGADHSRCPECGSPIAEQKENRSNPVARSN